MTEKYNNLFVNVAMHMMHTTIKNEYEMMPLHDNYYYTGRHNWEMKTAMILGRSKI